MNAEDWAWFIGYLLVAIGSMGGLYVTLRTPKPKADEHATVRFI